MLKRKKEERIYFANARTNYEVLRPSVAKCPYTHNGIQTHKAKTNFTNSLLLTKYELFNL